MAADSKTFVISTVTRGMCLETRPSGVSTGKYDSSGKTQSQLWTLENGEDGKSFAFRSVANGQYLRCNGKGDAAKTLTGDKSWWTLERGDAPGVWWLKNIEFGNYLCNYYGKQGPNNLVQMWSSNLQGWNYTMQWYINDSTAPGSFSAPGSGEGSASAQEQQQALEAKEKELQEREQKIEADEKDAVEREKAVAEREQKTELRTKELDGKESSTKQRTQDLEAREKTLTERTKGVEERERAIATGGAEQGGGSEASDQVAQLQRQLSDAQREHEETKSRLREQPAPPQSNAGSNAATGVVDNEKTKLRERIRTLESQLASKSGLPTNPNGSFERERKDLKPIVMQGDFGFLPRLTDEKVREPLSTNQPLRKMPPVKPPTFSRVR